MALVCACVFCHLLLCLYGDTRPWTWGSLVNPKAFTSRSLLQDISKDLPPMQSCTHASQGAPPFFLGGRGSPFNPDSERQHLLFECGCDRGPPLTGSHKVPGVSSVTPENAALRCGPGRAGRRLPAPEEPGGSCASAVPGSPPPTGQGAQCPASTQSEPLSLPVTVPERGPRPPSPDCPPGQTDGLLHEFHFLCGDKLVRLLKCPFKGVRSELPFYKN